MSKKNIVKIWELNNVLFDNISFLKENTKNVFFPLGHTSNQIILDLKDTYKSIPCAGVAANQIGYNKKIFIGLKHDKYDDGNDDKKEKPVIGNPNAKNYEFYINPQIDHSTNKSMQEGEEGCLSIPEIRIISERFDKIKVRYFDAEGKKIKKPLSGFMSRMFQHELDHLNGVLMVENSKIKNIYRISENENVELLYTDLVKKLSAYK